VRDGIVSDPKIEVGVRACRGSQTRTKDRAEIGGYGIGED
jgi:hypothetical protein